MGMASYNLSKDLGIYKHVLFKKLRKTGAYIKYPFGIPTTTAYFLDHIRIMLDRILMSHACPPLNTH